MPENILYLDLTRKQRLMVSVAIHHLLDSTDMPDSSDYEELLTNFDDAFVMPDDLVITSIPEVCCGTSSPS